MRWVTLLFALCTLTSCASRATYTTTGSAPQRIYVEIRNESIDPYVVRYKGMRLGGTISPGRTECVPLRGVGASVQERLTLRPLAAGEFTSWPFDPQSSQGWVLTISNISYAQGTAYIVPSAPCGGKRAPDSRK